MKPFPTPVRVDGDKSVASTGNVLPLLHEIKHHLRDLLESGKKNTIDISAIPMSPDDELSFEAFLGRGEVTASLESLGNSEIIETRFSGVWLITHHNAQGERIGRFIEITTMPEILKSQSQDMRAALTALDERLSAATA